MIPLSSLRAVPESSEYDLGQYYRSTYVIVLEDNLYRIRYVTSVDDDRLELDNERWVEHGDCYLFMPKSGWYGGQYISSSANRYYKKGMVLCSDSVMPLQRYLNTGAGYSAFCVKGKYVQYHTITVGVKVKTKDGELFVFSNEELATRFQEEYKLEVIYDI